MTRPRRYYRVISIIPIDKPTMVLGNGAPKQTGFSHVFGPLVTRQDLAKKLRRVLARTVHGQHTLQYVDVEPGAGDVITDNETVRKLIAADKARRAANDNGPRWYELDR